MHELLETYEDFKIGDIVALKTGSPDMILASFVAGEPLTSVPDYHGAKVTKLDHQPPEANCVWFQEGSPSAAVQRQRFPLIALVNKTKRDAPAETHRAA